MITLEKAIELLKAQAKFYEKMVIWCKNHDDKHKDMYIQELIYAERVIDLLTDEERFNDLYKEFVEEENE